MNFVKRTTSNALPQFTLEVNPPVNLNEVQSDQYAALIRAIAQNMFMLNAIENIKKTDGDIDARVSSILGDSFEIPEETENVLTYTKGMLINQLDGLKVQYLDLFERPEHAKDYFAADVGRINQMVQFVSQREQPIDNACQRSL